MNTEIITSILGIEIAFVVGFALPRLCAKIMMKAIGVTEDDYKFDNLDFDYCMKVYAFCRREEEIEKKLVDYAENYPHTMEFYARVINEAHWHCFRSQYPEQFMEEI